jgi:DNA modification methylase
MNKQMNPSIDESVEILLNKVMLQDCLEGMRALPDNSFDIAIADPPYNVSKGGNWSWDSSKDLPGFGGSWNKVMAEWDSMPLAQYLDFSLAWLAEVKRVIKPTGSIWVHGTYHNS